MTPRGGTIGPREFRDLWRLTRRRTTSKQSYLEFQAFQADLLIGYLQEHGVRFAGSTLLDLGSGVGGYGGQFAARGATVFSLDLKPLRRSDPGIHGVCANAGVVPLRDESVDLVFCASLLEHVPRPGDVLSEIERVLRPGGTAYVSFPPFYSPIGGHQLAPYHYFGERIAMRLKGRRPVPNWIQALEPTHSTGPEPANGSGFSEVFGDWGLYRMTIRGFRKLLHDSSFQRVEMSTRFLPVSFIRWPLVGEVLTWHAQFLLRKPLSSDRRSRLGAPIVEHAGSVA
jgi:SAM-dependent methyltransferase